MVSVHSDAYRDMVNILKVRRFELGLSQRALAKRLNVSQSYISKVEACELKLDVIEYFNYAASLEISLNCIETILSKHITFYKN